ncbi:DDE-type integrase/transposase/recombinase [Pantoea sp. Ep11b]|uniref:DDE-type integrase/transposase/recombinase n=1 Tax=Pantoea sp. Ep11b TaxID=3141459 RepID=UPI003461229A
MGHRKCFYRAVDTAGHNSDFLLTVNRDTSIAIYFFRKAIRHYNEPEVVNIDKSGANTAALVTFNAVKPDEKTITATSIKHRNNLITQHYRSIINLINPIRN